MSASAAHEALVMAQLEKLRARVSRAREITSNAVSLQIEEDSIATEAARRLAREEVDIWLNDVAPQLEGIQREHVLSRLARSTRDQPASGPPGETGAWLCIGRQRVIKRP